MTVFKEKLSPQAKYQLGELVARSISFGVKRAGLVPRQIISDAGQGATAIRVQTETGVEYVIPVHRIIEEGLRWYVANRIPNETPLPAKDTNRGATEVEKPSTPKRREPRLRVVPPQEKLLL
jgi:hypothetical protein